LDGLTSGKIDTNTESLAVTGDSSGLIQLNVGLLTTLSGLQQTTLVGFGPGYQSGVVLWSSSLPRASVSADIQDTLTPGNESDLGLTNGVRIQLQSRTNNAFLTNAVGFTVHIIEKGVSIFNLNTDSDGYLIIQDLSLDTLGEMISITVFTNDSTLNGSNQVPVADITTYL